MEYLPEIIRGYYQRLIEHPPTESESFTMFSLPCFSCEEIVNWIEKNNILMWCNFDIFLNHHRQPLFAQLVLCHPPPPSVLVFCIIGYLFNPVPDGMIWFYYPLLWLVVASGNYSDSKEW